MGTSTRSFGSSKREGHDSSAFYERKMRGHGEVKSDSTLQRAAATQINRVYCKSSERMADELPDNSVALLVTSPPYNVGKEYDIDLSMEEYKGLLSRVFREARRVMEPGGRVCINIANVGRKPYIPLASYVNQIMVDELGYLMRGEILWRKGEGASGSCAWGSWRSPRNPVLRDTHEYILVYSKDRFDRPGPKREASIGTDEFLSNSLSVWEMEPENASRVGHPAPFPEELPTRLIQFYTYVDDLVLDPFCGVGTTCVAAKKLGRRYIGYDIKEEYVTRAVERLEAVGIDPADFQRRSRLESPGAQKLAESLLQTSGFTITGRNGKLKGLGVQVSLLAEDKKGRPWYFDVAGAFTSQRAGLIRTDTLYKCLGRASVMAANATASNGYQRLVLLTTSLPNRGSAGDRSLRATRGMTFFDAIEMGNPNEEGRLTQYASGDYDRPLPGFWRPSDLTRPHGDIQMDILFPPQGT